ncbi:MAG: ATP-binding cassette domain-containing protein [Clostridia bacterium]|nr:ATP-binding cassette domain-containing protein [Clostridia bacterium]
MSRIKRVRAVLQMEITECGAASLAMILGYYGRTVPLEQLRRECCVSRNGVNAKNIVLAAKLHGLEVTPVKAEPEEFSDDNLPAIIHWNMDHFVVLCGFKRSGAVIADPESGVRTVSTDEFSRSYTGIALLMKPTETFKKTDNDSSFRSCYLYSRLIELIPTAVYFMLNEFSLLVGSMAIMILNSVYIDSVIIEDNMKGLGFIIGILLFYGTILFIALCLRQTLLWRLGKLLSARISTDFIDRLLRLPINFFSERGAGDLVNRQSANLDIGDGIAASFFPLPAYFMQILIYLGLLLFINSYIGAAAAFFGILNVLILILTMRAYGEKTLLLSRDNGALESYVSRTIDMIETIKSFGAEDSLFAKLIARGTAAINTRVGIDRIRIVSNSLFIFVNLLCSGTILVIGSVKIISGALGIGIFYTAQAVAAAMFTPIDSAVHAGISSYTIVGDMKRTDDIMYQGVDDMFAPPDAAGVSDFSGDIELTDVSFNYNTFDAPILSDINISVKRGSMVAVTGRSGCGKSTLAKIIAGIYKESGGCILYNGIPRKEIDRTEFYRKTTSVSQTVRLFCGTVLDNITMWDDTLSYDEVVMAAKAACIHDDIIARPHGYREIVSENGKNFSGGQRQRIELARALVKKPELLILDEATSALDADTEARIINNIKALGITVIIIAHRISTVLDSDEIIVLDNGKIAERGRHEELAAKNGIYSDLIRSNH